MNRYLEYNVDSGKILSEIFSESKPTAEDGIDYMLIQDSLVLDINNAIIKDNKIVRAYETAEERRERERLLREAKHRAHKRIKALIVEFNIAQLENDNNRINQLKEEYAELAKAL